MENRERKRRRGRLPPSAAPVNNYSEDFLEALRTTDTCAFEPGKWAYIEHELSQSEEVLVGLEKLVEVPCNSARYEPGYYCSLCDVALTCKGVIAHVVSTQHRRLFLKCVYGDSFGQMLELPPWMLPDADRLADEAIASRINKASSVYESKYGRAPIELIFTAAFSNGLIRCSVMPPNRLGDSSIQRVAQVHPYVQDPGHFHRPVEIAAVPNAPEPVAVPIPKGPESVAALTKELATVPTRAFAESEQCAISDLLADYPVPLVGLELLIEIPCSDPDFMPAYYCQVCDLCIVGGTTHVTAHLSSIKHMRTYLDLRKDQDWSLALHLRNAVSQKDYIQAAKHFEENNGRRQVYLTFTRAYHPDLLRTTKTETASKTAKRAAKKRKLQNAESAAVEGTSAGGASTQFGGAKSDQWSSQFSAYLETPTVLSNNARKRQEWDVRQKKLEMRKPQPVPAPEVYDLQAVPSRAHSRWGPAGQSAFAPSLPGVPIAAPIDPATVAAAAQLMISAFTSSCAATAGKDGPKADPEDAWKQLRYLAAGKNPPGDTKVEYMGKEMKPNPLRAFSKSKAAVVDPAEKAEWEAYNQWLCDHPDEDPSTAQAKEANEHYEMLAKRARLTAFQLQPDAYSKRIDPSMNDAPKNPYGGSAVCSFLASADGGGSKKRPSRFDKDPKNPQGLFLQGAIAQSPLKKPQDLLHLSLSPQWRNPQGANEYEDPFQQPSNSTQPLFQERPDSYQQQANPPQPLFQQRLDPQGSRLDPQGSNLQASKPPQSLIQLCLNPQEEAKLPWEAEPQDVFLQQHREPLPLFPPRPHQLDQDPQYLERQNPQEDVKLPWEPEPQDVKLPWEVEPYNAFPQQRSDPSALFPPPVNPVDPIPWGLEPQAPSHQELEPPQGLDKTQEPSPLEPEPQKSTAGQWKRLIAGGGSSEPAKNPYGGAAACSFLSTSLSSGSSASSLRAAMPRRRDPPGRSKDAGQLEEFSAKLERLREKTRDDFDTWGMY